MQIHTVDYRNPAALPEGAVVVVGSGQSGAQIAEDLHLAGRKMHRVTGNAPRCARFYRGRDVVDWLWDVGQYAITVADYGVGHKRHDTNHYLTGRDGGRDIDLRAFVGRRWRCRMGDRLPPGLVVRAPADLRWDEVSDQSVRRDQRLRRLCPRVALALDLGLGAIPQRRPGRGTRRGGRGRPLPVAGSRGIVREVAGSRAGGLTPIEPTDATHVG